MNLFDLRQIPMLGELTGAELIKILHDKINAPHQLVQLIVHSRCNISDL